MADCPFREILVPLDGSRGAERALGPALDIARRTDVPLRLLRSAPRPRRRAVGGYLADLANRCAGVVDVEVQATSEPVVDAIWAAADPGTLVCMSPHRHPGAAWAAVGSVTEAVLRVLDEPTLVVGPHVAPHTTFGAGRVVACLDGSVVADRALAPAGAWSACLGLPLWLVEVAPPGPTPEVQSGGLVGEGGYLAAQATEGTGVAGWDVVHDRDPAHGLVTFARDLPVAALVVATHARGGWDRLALGSVTARTVQAASVPVLVVPPDGLDDDVS